MAEVKQQLNSTKASTRKTTAATRKNGRKPAAPPVKPARRKPGPPAKAGCGSDKQINSKKQKQAPANVSVLKPGEGGSSLLRAFNQVVAEYSLSIAKAIVKKVMQGDINGARFLDEVTGAKAQRNQPPQKPYRPLVPWTAEHLAAEPNWQEPSDPEVDTGFGGREPEN